MSTEQHEEGRPQTTYDRIKKWLDNAAMRDILVKTLPRSVAVDPWTQVALQTVRLDDKLMQAEPMSVMGSIMTVASLGLRLDGPLGQAYLTTRAVRTKDERSGYWQFSHYECQVAIGYKGFVDIVYRDNTVADVKSTIVYESDDFSFQLGSNPDLVHRWDHRLPIAERGDMVAVYTGLRYKDGFYSFDVYPMADIWELRDIVLRQNGVRVDATQQPVAYYKRKGDGEYQMSRDQVDRVPWITHERPMIMKTGIRWSAKYWRLSPDLHRAAALVDQEELGRSQRLGEYAETLMPRAITTQVKANTPNSRLTAPAQADSLARSTDLAARMAAEAGISPQGAPDRSQMDGPADGRTSSRGDQGAAQTGAERGESGESTGAQGADPTPGDADGAPGDAKGQTRSKGRPAKTDAQTPAREPSDEEKAEILAAEQAEAEQFEAERAAQLDLNGRPGSTQKKRTSSKKRG